MKASQASQHCKELLMSPASKEATYVICALLPAEVKCDMWNILVTVCRGLWMEVGSGGKRGKWTAAVWYGNKDVKFRNFCKPSNTPEVAGEWKTGFVRAVFSAPGAIP